LCSISGRHYHATSPKFRFAALNKNKKQMITKIRIKKSIDSIEFSEDENHGPKKNKLKSKY
jgi:hypothetical protein